MTHFKYACRTCRRKALFDDEEKAMRWWLKHDGHDRIAKIIRDEPPPLAPRARRGIPSMGQLAFCQSCRKGEILHDFEADYDAWSAKHRGCR